MTLGCMVSVRITEVHCFAEVVNHTPPGVNAVSASVHIAELLQRHQGNRNGPEGRSCCVLETVWSEASASEDKEPFILF